MNTKVPINLDLAIVANKIGSGDQTIDLVSHLKQVVGAIDYDGEASVQVLLPLQGGGYIRIGVTDNDVSSHRNCLWADRYKGLAIKGETNLQTGEKF